MALEEIGTKRASTSPGAPTMAAFLGATVIGGGNFTAVAFSNEELAPLYGAGMRFAAAAALMFLINFWGGYELPRGRAVTGAVIYGSLAFGTTYGLLYFAVDGLGAGATSIIVAAAPLMTLVVAVLAGQERFSTRGLVGGALVIVGFAVLSVEKLGASIRPVYLVVGILGVLSIAGSTVVIKGYPQAHPVTSNAIGMTAGAILLAAGSLLSREPWVLPSAGRTWLALLWLVAFGSVGMFILFLYVVKNWTASATVYAVTLMPIVAIPVAAVMVGEQVTLPTLAGAGLVIAAVYIGALRKEQPREKAAVLEAPEPAAGG
jgi:drug/metabolite transporter (DMT)-like permease